jgi:hypothetical protein
LPTPIEHLVIAQQILASPTLPEAMRTWLDKDEIVRGAFFFGHIAPDVQVVSRQPRETTHFFSLPPTNRRPAYERMLAAHPSLVQPSALPATQAAFLAGYMAHLLLDERWVREIFSPVFGPGQTWADRRERFLRHNLLRAWLTRRDLPLLQDGVGDLLRQARPDGWLPFAADADLCRWRDLVADQFEPGAAIRTVEVFANRARIPDAEFLALLKPDVMEKHVFNRIPLAELDEFHARATDHAHHLIVSYLDGCVVGESG